MTFIEAVTAKSVLISLSGKFESQISAVENEKRTYLGQCVQNSTLFFTRTSGVWQVSMETWSMRRSQMMRRQYWTQSNNNIELLDP